jgi:hypothetical protein
MIKLAILPDLSLIHRQKGSCDPHATICVAFEQPLTESCESTAAVEVSGASVNPKGDEICAEADIHQGRTNKGKIACQYFA